MRRPLVLALVLVLLAGCRTSVRAAPSAIGIPLDGLEQEAAGDPCAPKACGPCRGPCKPHGCEPSLCWDTYLDSTASFLPTLGIGFGAGRVLCRTARHAWSAGVSRNWQFADDEPADDDPNPAGGRGVQLRLGFEMPSKLQDLRQLRTFLDAQRAPDAIEHAGTDHHLDGSPRRETVQYSALTVRPELSTLALGHDGELPSRDDSQRGIRSFPSHSDTT